MRYHALIPAAGNGRRFRGDAPKQYWMLAGKPVLAHSLERLAAAFPFLDIVAGAAISEAHLILLERSNAPDAHKVATATLA